MSSDAEGFLCYQKILIHASFQLSSFITDAFKFFEGRLDDVRFELVHDG